MILLALLLGASAGAASPAPPPPQSDIVVEGRRSAKQAIHDFVAATTPAPVGGQLVRFQDAVCPAATGLPESQNRQIVARLREVGGAIGLELAPEPCGPNALVIVVDDKQQFIAALRERYPAYFRSGLDERAVVPKEKGPAAAWHIDGLLSADHAPAAAHTPGANGEPGTYSMTSSMDSSRLRPPAIPRFLAGVLVVEARALAGLSTRQLADYAAMRLYATTDPDRLKRSASSILGVLDAPMGSAIPLSLTSWDLSFLKGLYHTDDRQFANRQRNQIERSVRKDAGAER